MSENRKPATDTLVLARFSWLRFTTIKLSPPKGEGWVRGKQIEEKQLFTPPPHPYLLPLEKALFPNLMAVWLRLPGWLKYSFCKRITLSTSILGQPLRVSLL